jgi:two-component sensor histidine kinase/CheY-like chemotaxis protein
MKVVMVDDSAAERKLCRLLLEEAHGPQLEFFEADTAAGGLEMIVAEKPDCVLLDYRLPDMTGLELLAQLDSSYRGVPSAVVMLTGVTSEQVAVEAMKAGAQDYLVKDRITSGSLSMAIQKATQKVGLMRALKAERDRLARSLEEKEVLLQEVHHRVKNNLQVVASLLRLQAEEGQTAVDALRESQLRVETMAMIHEQLYQSGDLRQVNLAEHAALLTNNLLTAYGAGERIAGRVAMEPLVLGVDQAIPAGLILNELISNGLKHAFPGGRCGEIAVEGGLVDGRAVLTVRDDGSGLPEEFDLKKGTSLGLRIVQILTRQLKGTFEVDRAGMTRFRVCFPVVTGAPGGNNATS